MAAGYWLNFSILLQVDGLKNELALKERFAGGDACSEQRCLDDNVRDEKITEVCRAYEHRIAALEAHIQTMQSPCEIEPPLTSASSVAVRSVNSASNSNPATSPGSDVRTPTPTSNFLQSIGIDSTSVNSSSWTIPASIAGSLGEKQLNALLGGSDEGFDEVPSPTIEEFAKEEDKRIEQLESNIEKHIDGMRIAMDLAMEKYLAKS